MSLVDGFRRRAPSDEDDVFETYPSAANVHNRNNSNHHEGGGPEGKMDYDQDLKDDPEDAIFHVEQLEWASDSKLGNLTSVSVGSSLLLISTQNNYVIRWNVDTDAFEEIQVSKRSSDVIYKVFVNATGQHSIIAMQNGQNYYINTKRNKPILLKKVSNLQIESVAWNGPQESSNSTGPILLGTRNGLIFETCITDDRDKYIKSIYNVNEATDKEASPVSGIHIELFPESDASSQNAKFFVLVATPIRFFEVIGGPTFEAMFDVYRSSPKFKKFVELPTDLSYSTLAFYNQYQGRHQAEHCAADSVAWLTGPGIFHGNLVFGSQQPGDMVISNGALLSYPAVDQTVPLSLRGEDTALVKPLSLIRTQFHFLLLTENRLMAVNQLSDEVVFDREFDTKTYGKMRGLTFDNREEAVFMYSDKFVFEIEVESEDRDVWRLYLKMDKFADALSHCETNQQAEVVLNAQADYYFEKGSYESAAKIYAKTNRSFEEVTLKFVDTGDGARNALKTFLLTKLNQLEPEEVTQQAMVCTWLTEIFLDNLNALEDKNDTLASNGHEVTDEEYERNEEAYEQELKLFLHFLTSYDDVLRDLKQTTFDLISSHGRTKELLFYAELIGDLEWVLNFYVNNKDYRQCVVILAKLKHPSEPRLKDPSKHSDLFYKFAPVLLQYVPKDMIDLLVNLKQLQPVKFITALMRYDSGVSDAKRNSVPTVDDLGNSTNQAIRYLEHVVFRLRNNDGAIHNFLVSLYVKQNDEGPLLTFIKRFRERPIYDHKYALRLCHQYGRRQACVAIYTAMKRFDVAVKLALETDIEEAKHIAGLCDEEEDKKKLWLRIAKHVIAQENDIHLAMDILKECPQYLTLESILPYFPDFVKIGAFKTEICQSLEVYNDNIDSLKSTMDAYTDTAKTVRRQISELKKRNTLVRNSHRCEICSLPVLTRQFLVFPCTHAMHLDCSMRVNDEYLQRNPRVAIDVLGADSTGDPQARNTALKNFAASECSLCGDVMIESISLPFIQPHLEEAELASWEITTLD